MDEVRSELVSCNTIHLTALQMESRMNLNLWIARVFNKREHSHLCGPSTGCLLFGHTEIETGVRNTN
ncbi:UNVERIFIED_CONTAM: hypothetical protein NY603_22275, partial [Bacteroidetes bacterium 56_B9]